MKHWMRLLASLWSTFVLLATTGLVAYAESPDWASGHLAQEPRTGQTVAESCTKMEVSDPALWFATDEEGLVDTGEVVDAYPTGAVTIAAGFEYNCVPSKIKLGIVGYALTFDEDPWFSDEVKWGPFAESGVAYYPITLKRNEPIPDGKYRIEFYVGEDLLTSGDATVGESKTDSKSAQDWFQKDEAEQQEQEQEEPQPTEQQEREEPQPTEEQEQEKQKEQEQEQNHEEERRQRENKVQIVGTITDGYTDRPIKGAVFIVLQPGITAAQWADYAYAPSDILTTNETDRSGRFKHPGLDRNVEYSVIAWALSYQGWYQDGFLLTEDDPDPYELNITLYR